MRTARSGRWLPAMALCSAIAAAIAVGCSTSATRTEGTAPIDNVGIQTQARCIYVKEFQLFLYTADLQINGGQGAGKNAEVAKGLTVAGTKVQGAIPEFTPYVAAITNDRVARLSAATPPTTTVNLDDARQIIGTYQSANCPDAPPGSTPGQPAAGAAPGR